MAALFYDHLIPWEKVELYIRLIDVGGEEKLEVIELIEETIHGETLLVILRHLPTEKHEEFVERFHAAPHHRDHIEYLKTHGHPEIEQKIREAAEKVVAELMAELENEEETTEPRS